MMAVGALVLAACGGDDDDDAGGGDTEAPGTEAAAPGTEAPAPDTEAPAPDTEAPAPGTDAPPATEGGSEAPAGMIQKPGECGMGTGEEATGEPIKMGAMATTAEGYVFDWIPKMTQIYYDCVNANGGINGRPIELTILEEQLDPAQVESLAIQLVEEEEVVGITGSTSAIECDINDGYYTQFGIHPLIAGVAPTCFTSPNWSAVNMGPYYSNLGAAQAAIRMGATGKLVVVSPDEPGMDFNNQGAIEYAESQGLEGIGLTTDTPIADPAGLAQRLVQEAGEGGAVVLNFVPPVVLPVLQAIDEQGLIDSVVWASSTPPNDNSVAAALSDAWDGKFFINAEFDVLDSGKPDNVHMVGLHTDAAPDFPMGAFPQMGYLVGRIATEALLSIDGEVTRESFNEALVNLTGFESDLLCKPWYYSSGLDVGNVGNNADRTVTPEGDVMVLAEDCFDIAAVPSNPLEEIRAAEAAQG